MLYTGLALYKSVYVCAGVWLWVGHGCACLAIYTGQLGDTAEVNQRTVKKEGICHRTWEEIDAGG